MTYPSGKISEIENKSAVEVKYKYIRDLLCKMMIEINLFYQDKNTVLNAKKS
jgi:hypothetical protein